MTYHDDFLRAIIERPDDDLPRSVFADWLEGNAGSRPCYACSDEVKTDCKSCKGTGSVTNGFAERAEFIRLQIELHNHKYRDDLLLFNSLGSRSSIRISKRGSAWRQGLALVQRINELHQRRYDYCWYETVSGWYDLSLSVKYSRGFIYSMRVSYWTFIDNAKKYFSYCPLTDIVFFDNYVYLTSDNLWIVALPHDCPFNPCNTLQGSRYDNRRDAIKVISNAAVSYGRQLAGLPPLTC